MTLKRCLFNLLALGALWLPLAASAQVRIDLTQGNAAPMPVALVNFHTEASGMKKMAREVREVIVNDLDSSGLFNVLDEKAHLQSDASLASEGPKYQEWKLVKAEALMMGNMREVVEDGAEKISVEYRLLDVYGEKQLAGRVYTVEKRFWRYMAHKIADDIYTAMTGEKGYFASRIVHIAEEMRGGRLLKKLCVMDQDGANYQCLTNGSHLVLTPRFSPVEQQLIYMSYANGLPRLYFLDLPTGRQEIVGDFEGLNSSPRFAPDGRSIVMTLTKGHAGNPEIYAMDLVKRELVRLTNNSGIDTSPDFSPDGKRIVFNSDRGGKPALYMMNRDGSDVKRLTYGEGRYYAPVWSPRGDLIAFVKEYKGRFGIGVIDIEGREERMLTDSFLDESPTWSPNGRVIAFARQMGNSTKMYSIDLTGYNERVLKTPTNASDPAWSPSL